MINVENLTKIFGKVKAVDGISFNVQKGEIFGLLGENGAGKTTTLRMLATMLKPSAGSVSICGLDAVKEPEKVRMRIGILFGGETGLYDRLTAAENIAYFGELNDIDRTVINERIKKFSETFGMREFLNRKASKLSKGMKQKVAFARCIIHDPEVMLFDEPTSGLDVGAMREVHSFIGNCKNNGKTIIFSSHTMSEVEKLCDRVGIIHKGKLVCTETVEGLKEKYQCQDLEEIFIRLVGAENAV